MTDDFLNDVDILTQLSRAQEQSEAAAASLASVYIAVFNQLIGEGMMGMLGTFTRDEALVLTQSIMGQLLARARGGDDE